MEHNYGLAAVTGGSNYIRCLMMRRRIVGAMWFAILAAILTADFLWWPVSQDARIVSILRWDDRVLVSTTRGIYQASVAEQRWQVVVTPFMMKPCAETLAELGFGNLTRDVKHEGTVYVSNESGIWLSTDFGESWSRQSTIGTFQELYSHPQTGVLYGITQETETVPNQKDRYILWRIKQSFDQGMTWRDISGDIAKGMSLSTILQDPDRPELICLFGNSIRGYLLRPVTSEYSQWEPVAFGDNDIARRNLASYLSTTSVAYVLDATLGNYFQNGFGESPSINGFGIETEQQTYSFKKSGGKVIAASIVFRCEESDEGDPGRRDEHTTTLLDSAQSGAFWSIRVIDTDGRFEAGVGMEIHNQWYEADNRDELMESLWKTYAVFYQPISRSMPYRREIDLDQLYTFKKAGRYKVQLSYGDDAMAKNRKAWGGGFSGTPFYVEIE